MFSNIDHYSFSFDPLAFLTLEDTSVYVQEYSTIRETSFGYFSFDPIGSSAYVYKVIVEDIISGEVLLLMDGINANVQTDGDNGTIPLSVDVRTSTPYTDTMTGGYADDRLYGWYGDDYIIGNAGADTLIGGSGNDHLSGGDGNDTLIGVVFQGYGGLVPNDSDEIDGGQGLDTAQFRFAFQSCAVTFEGLSGAIKVIDARSTDTLTNVELIEFTRYIANESVQGPTKFALVYEGNTLTSSLADALAVQRSLGQDIGVLAFKTISETVDTDGLTTWIDLRGGGNDMLVATGGADRIAAGDGADQIASGDGVDTLYGDGGNDALLGEGDNDTILGGVGDDAINGGDGGDRLYGEDGKDNVVSGLGNDRAYGGVGDDRLAGDAGSDILLGDAGNDRLSGGDHTDRIYGGDGDDILLGGNGNDTAYGEAGADRLYCGEGNDIALGGIGIDTLYGEAGSDRLYGGSDADTMLGGSGNDIMFGEDGADRIFGEIGNDRLSGGLGNDALSGGAGGDVFVFSDDNQGNDRVDDWEAIDDQIEIDASAFGGGLATGPLAANRLVVGAAPVANQAFGQFLYNSASGQLSWDVDGTGATAAVAITRLLNGGVVVATLAVADFDIVA
jgi:Ca2+-binding RTX toxin-like protein